MNPVTSDDRPPGDRPLGAHQADEEDVRFPTSFNDVFVTLAIFLVLVALAWFGGQVSRLLAGTAVAAASWLLAEFFTRRRRMALPSIVLVLTFTGGMFAVGLGLAQSAGLTAQCWISPTLMAGATAALAAWAHWVRFRVPITVGLGALALFWTILGLLVASVPALSGYSRELILIGGLALFAVALRWDASDRARVTRRSDIGFWLHMFAAPMIVHPLFAWIGLIGGRSGSQPVTTLLLGLSAPATYNPAMVVVASLEIGIYLLLGLVAVIVDRRAILVSGLAYVIYAMAVLFRAAGSLNASLALTALLVGGLLLVLSAFWRPIRRVVLRIMPAPLRDRVPVTQSLAASHARRISRVSSAGLDDLSMEEAGVLRICLFACVALPLSGCVNVNVGKHVAASDYTGEVKRIAIFMPDDEAFGSGFDKNFPASFKQAVQAGLGACGVASLVYQVDPMQLDGLAKAKAALAAFQPGNTLLIQHTYRFLMNGEERGETYVFTLSDIAQHRDIWKGTVGIGASAGFLADRSQTGAVLAEKMLRQMADDAVLRNCPIAAKPA